MLFAKLQNLRKASFLIEKLSKHSSFPKVLREEFHRQYLHNSSLRNTYFLDHVNDWKKHYAKVSKRNNLLLLLFSIIFYLRFFGLEIRFIGGNVILPMSEIPAEIFMFVLVLILHSDLQNTKNMIWVREFLWQFCSRHEGESDFVLKSSILGFGDKSVENLVEDRPIQTSGHVLMYRLPITIELAVGFALIFVIGVFPLIGLSWEAIFQSAINVFVSIFIVITIFTVILVSFIRFILLTISFHQRT